MQTANGYEIIKSQPGNKSNSFQNKTVVGKKPQLPYRYTSYISIGKSPKDWWWYAGCTVCRQSADLKLYILIVTINTRTPVKQNIKKTKFVNWSYGLMYLFIYWRRIAPSTAQCPLGACDCSNLTQIQWSTNTRFHIQQIVLKLWCVIHNWFLNNNDAL